MSKWMLLRTYFRVALVLSAVLWRRIIWPVFFYMTVLCAVSSAMLQVFVSGLFGMQKTNLVTCVSMTMWIVLSYLVGFFVASVLCASQKYSLPKCLAYQAVPPCFVVAGLCLVMLGPAAALDLMALRG